jgi:hypothetical protein
VLDVIGAASASVGVAKDDAIAPILKRQSAEVALHLGWLIKGLGNWNVVPEWMGKIVLAEDRRILCSHVGASLFWDLVLSVGTVKQILNCGSDQAESGGR